MSRIVARLRYLLWLAPVGIIMLLSGCSGISRREAQSMTKEQVQGPSGARVAAAAAPAKTEPTQTYPVKIVSDIAYYTGPDADPVRHKLDLYLPEGLTDFPVLVFIHGGGWTMGSKNQWVPFLGAYKNLGEAFARQGIGTVLSNYRLSPKYKHPAHIEDVARTWAWVYRNIAQYGGRPNEMFAMGQSAGGHLVALLATDPRYLQAQSLSTDTIRGVIAMSGVYKLDFGMGTNGGQPPKMITQAFGNDPAVWADVSPINHVHPGLPPFLVISAGREWAFLRAQAERFAVALENSGDRTDFLILPDKNHFTEVGDIGSKGDVATTEVAAFIRSHLP